jgi:membrane-bound ClpP family serine protease
LQVIGAAILFHGLQVSWVLIVVMVGLSLAYHHLVLLPTLEKARKQTAVIDDNGQLVGAYGRVVKATERVGSAYRGAVIVRGEQWTAISDHPLRTGDDVVIVERDGLQLYVEGIKQKQAAKEG